MEPVLCTEEYRKLLVQIPLFRDLPLNIQNSLLDKLSYTVYHIKKGEVILRQNSPCKHLYILLKGKLCVNMIDALGNEVLIEHIIAPRTFASSNLFKANGIFPASFTASNDGILFKATKDSIFQLISEYPALLKSFLCVLSNCTKCTLTRLSALSQKGVRNRFIVYLFEHKPTGEQCIEVEHNQVQLADYLCVSRPALSKEINKMVKEELIRIKGKKVELLEVDKLKRMIL